MEKFIWVGKKMDDEEVVKFLNDELYTCDLDKISQKYNCDKSSSQYMSVKHRNVPHGWDDDFILRIAGHNYVEVYDSFFKEIRNDKLKILEIGMGNYPTNGYSMRMWLDYFPNSEIVIIDNNPNNFYCDFVYESERVKFYKVDQSVESELSSFADLFEDNHFDIIIDDGSHVATHQFLTFKYLFKKLKNDKRYFIEDIHDEKSKEYLLTLFEILNRGSLCPIYNEHQDMDISSINLFRSLISIYKGKKITR